MLHGNSAAQRCASAGSGLTEAEEAKMTGPMVRCKPLLAGKNSDARLLSLPMSSLPQHADRSRNGLTRPITISDNKTAPLERPHHLIDRRSRNEKMLLNVRFRRSYPVAMHELLNEVQIVLLASRRFGTCGGVPAAPACLQPVLFITRTVKV